MRTEMVIRMQASSEKDHSKAMKIAAETQGVESVTLAGKDRTLLLVIGDGVDCNELTTRLRKKVGHADVVELRTLHDSGGYSYAPRAGLARDADYGNYGYPAPVSYAPASEYYSHHHRPSYDYYNPPPPYPATVVHHEYYPAGDQDSCAIM